MPENTPVKTDPMDLVHLIVWHAVERGNVLTAIRVVKFLYLADLYHARAHEGRTLTGFPWAFVHYGPYCTQALDALSESIRMGRVIPTPYRSRYTDEERFMYSCSLDEIPALARTLPNELALPLRRIVHRYADDTSGLLDLVYFETEPMIAAKRGERLNFTLAAPPATPDLVGEFKRLSGPDLRRARDLVDRLRRRVEADLRARPTDWLSEDADGSVAQALDESDSNAGSEVIEAVAELDPKLSDSADE